MAANSTGETPEFSGLRGRFFAWFLTSPLRRVLDFKMGKPDARFMELLELRGDELVVDAGSGSGYHTLMVAERLDSGRVIAADVSKEMLDRLRRNADARGLAQRVELLEADILSLPVDTASADRCFCVAVWHHLDDPLRSCAEMARVLRPGARLVAIDLEIQRGSKAVPVQGHDRSFGPETMTQILSDAGLESIQVERLGRWVIGSAVKPSD